MTTVAFPNSLPIQDTASVNPINKPAERGVCSLLAALKQNSQHATWKNIVKTLEKSTGRKVSSELIAEETTRTKEANATKKNEASTPISFPNMYAQTNRSGAAMFPTKEAASRYTKSSGTSQDTSSNTPNRLGASAVPPIATISNGRTFRLALPFAPNALRGKASSERLKVDLLANLMSVIRTRAAKMQSADAFVPPASTEKKAHDIK